MTAGNTTLTDSAVVDRRYSALSVDPEQQARQRDSREQTERRDKWTTTETIRHDDSNDRGGYQTERGGEHEITERCRLPARRARDVCVLVDERKGGERRRRGVGLVLVRLVPVEELPRTGHGEEDQHRGEETAEIKMERAERFHRWAG